LAWYHLCQS